MKKALPLAALLAALSVSSSFAENLLQNGDFELEAGDEDVQPFYRTPHWYNPADAGSNKAMGTNARATEGSMEGSTYSATVNDRDKEISWFVQKTEHSIEEGEVFEVSLMWKAGWQWQSQDVLRVTVFAKRGDTLGGETVWEDTFDFERAPTGAWEKFTHAFNPATPEAAGKTLYFQFSGVDPQQAGVTGFSRVDNIELTVKPK